MLNKLKVTSFLSRHVIRAIHPKTYESLPYCEKTDKKHDRGCFPIMFPFLGMLHSLLHSPEHSHTHTWIFFLRFSQHSVFWVSGLCIDSFSGNACVMLAPATGRPVRWIWYTTTTTPPLLLGVIHRDNRNVTCLRGLGGMPLHLKEKKRSTTIFSTSVKWQWLRERYGKIFFWKESYSVSSIRSKIDK